MTIIGSLKLKRFRHCCFFGAVLLFSAPPTCTQSLSSTPAPTISVNTNLVVLPVSITDANGDVVLGLDEQNFRVYEDGRLQKVIFFKQGDTPVTVGLIVDHSRSMAGKLAEVAAAVSSFAQSSNPQDEMFVVDFNDDVSVELLGGKPFTNDPAELAKAVSSVHARGRTALYDAVAEGLLHLQLGHSVRKALIIVSDGGDNASLEKFSHLLALSQQSQALIYSIALIDEDGDVNPGVLRRLSKTTGGIAYFPDATHTVTTISAQIARDLREQYTLGFAPENANKSHDFRRIEVKVAASGHGKIHIRTRSGYFVADEKHSPARAAQVSK